MEQDTLAGQEEEKAKPEQYVKLRPTLFIGLGGTGMEVDCGSAQDEGSHCDALCVPGRADKAFDCALTLGI